MDLNLGANIKYIKRQIKDNIGSGTGFDVSFLTKTDLSVLLDVDGLGKISFGTNFQDVSGTQITWGQNNNFHKDEVLYNSKIGVALEQPLPKLTSIVTIDLDNDYVYKQISHWGLDWDYNSKGNLRICYYDNNVTAGASVKLYGIFIDYAILSNPLGLTNRVGMRFGF